MPDGTLQAIDRFFDLVDHGVDHVERILNRGKQAPERHAARKLPRSRVLPACKPPAAASATRALARKAPFYIVEAITSSGVTEFVVTDGGSARTACPSRAAAEQILLALGAQ